MSNQINNNPDSGVPRRRRQVIVVVVTTMLVTVAAIATLAASEPPADEAAAADKPAAVKSSVVVNQRAAGLEFYPCNDCHDMVDLQTPTMPPREPHDAMVFGHMPSAGDCFQCHNADNLDTLRLHTGAAIPFDDADKLCGQCHFEKHRDWSKGIHGKQVGSWAGTKHRYTCADCHSPHDPGIGPMTARPPPPFPRLGIRKHNH